MTAPASLSASLGYTLLTGAAVALGVVLWVSTSDGEPKSARAIVAIVLLTVCRVGAWGTTLSMVARTPGAVTRPLGLRAGLMHAGIDVGVTGLVLAAAWIVSGALGPHASGSLRALATAVVIAGGVAVMMATPSPLLMFVASSKRRE